MDRDEFCTYIADMSIKSMLYEVSATPKPGLVDRSNQGAHRDMDFFTFINSISVLYSYFYNCTRAGVSFKKDDYTLLLKSIRPIGINAERKMFKATNGINTHKGMIFSLGILNAAVGSLFRDYKRDIYSPKVLKMRIMHITKGISEELEITNDKLTYGEKLYEKHGIKGIRGEVENGFPNVLEISLPIFKSLFDKKVYCINDILVHTLLHLIKDTEDSNILGRHNMDILSYAQESAKEALDLGGYLTPRGRCFVKKMDFDFIQKNISSGGSADLLAITIMFFLIENGDEL